MSETTEKCTCCNGKRYFSEGPFDACYIVPCDWCLGTGLEPKP
jgi:hypothetical protein